VYHASFRINVNCLTVLDRGLIVLLKHKTFQIKPAHHPYRCHPVVIYERQNGRADRRSQLNSLSNFNFYQFLFVSSFGSHNPNFCKVEISANWKSIILMSLFKFSFFTCVFNGLVMNFLKAETCSEKQKLIEVKLRLTVCASFMRRINLSINKTDIAHCT
jgi:hypothetical protein